MIKFLKIPRLDQKTFFMLQEVIQLTQCLTSRAKFKSQVKINDHIVLTIQDLIMVYSKSLESTGTFSTKSSCAAVYNGNLYSFSSSICCSSLNSLDTKFTASSEPLLLLELLDSSHLLAVSAKFIAIYSSTLELLISKDINPISWACYQNGKLILVSGELNLSIYVYSIILSNQEWDIQSTLESSLHIDAIPIQFCYSDDYFFVAGMAR